MSCVLKSILLLFMSKYEMHFNLTVTLNDFMREMTSTEIYYGFNRAINQIWSMKHLHLRIRFLVSSISVLVFGKVISFLVTHICKNDRKFEEKLNVISTELRKSRVSKLQTEILLLISALYFNFAIISNDI